MLKKKIGGNSYTKDDKYILKILEENDKFYQYEPRLMLKAFRYTLQYFFKNCIEFSFDNFFEFKKTELNEKNVYVRYRQEYTKIPKHTNFVCKTFSKIKDYLNYRKEFENVRRREMLPDNERRNTNIIRGYL